MQVKVGASVGRQRTIRSIDISMLPVTGAILLGNIAPGDV